MSDTEEETYSVIFNSLRHPARRKILRMLSESTMSFSQMLEELTIPSSHLTYHLENLGDLVIKDKSGKYGLSSFGKASVTLMKGAEEVPNGRTKKFSALPIKWKTVFTLFAIVIVILASLSYSQYAAMIDLSNEYATLKADLDRVQVENQQLLSWSPSTTQAMTIIKEVIQMDTSKYQTTLLSNNAEVRSEIGGIIEEEFKYTLKNSQSSFELTLRFRNGHFSQFVLIQLEGYPNYPPIYTQPQPTEVMQATKELILRYQDVTNESYLDEAITLLSATDNHNGDQTRGNTKLRISDYGTSANAKIMYTENGIDFEAKSLIINFQNNGITSFSDDWFLFKVGSTQIDVSRDQAILAARDAVRNFSWNADGIHVTNFQVADDPVSAVIYPKSRAEPLTLMPYWFVTLYLDQTYPGNVNAIVAGVWADTGEVVNIQPFSGQVSP